MSTYYCLCMSVHCIVVHAALPIHNDMQYIGHTNQVFGNVPFSECAVFGSCSFLYVLFLFRAVFVSCPLWFVPFLVRALFGSCSFLFVLFISFVAFLSNITYLNLILLLIEQVIEQLNPNFLNMSQIAYLNKS